MPVKIGSSSEDDKNLVKMQNNHLKTRRDNRKMIEIPKPSESAKNENSIMSSLFPLNMNTSIDRSSVSGEIYVANSDKVIIGNNTYFRGPVSIEKIVQKTPSLNSSPVKNEAIAEQSSWSDEEDIETSYYGYPIQKWHINTFVVCLFTFNGIAILFNRIVRNYYENISLSVEDISFKTGYVKLLKLCYDNLNFMTYTIVLTPILLLFIFSVYVHYYKNKEHPDDIEEVYDNLMRPNKIVKRPVITPEGLRLVSRTVWKPQPVVYELDRLRQPVPWVIIAHTATGGGNTQRECCRHLRIIQKYHKDSQDWDDIGYNFLVGGDGSAYFGRGWDYEGAHTRHYNKYSIGIGFIGTFNRDPPPKRQLEACKKLIQRGVAIGKIAKDYRLLAHRQLWATNSPGDKLFAIIKTWPHFVNNYNDFSELLPEYF